MPPLNRKRPARNRRQQKATRRSKRVAGESPAPGDGDESMHLDEGVEEVVSPSRSCSTEWTDATSDEGDVDQAVGPARPCANSPIERLPSELVTLIGQQLPVESRITLALASRTMMFQSGGIGAGTNNIASDEDPREAGDEDMEEEEEPEEDAEEPAGDEGYPSTTPRMMLLALLERDLLLLTRCDYCRVLHSPSVGDDNALLECCKFGSCFTSGVGGWGAVRITLPLVRRAVLWDRQGLDADSLLATAICSTVDRSGRSNPYNSVSTSWARVRGGSVVLRTQLFVARATPRVHGGVPTARELAALDDILSSESLNWARDSYQAHTHPKQKYRTPQCLAKDEASGKSHYNTFRCYRDNAGPPLRALNPKLRCMLAHKVSCRAPVCRRQKALSGAVNGSQARFFDHSASAIAGTDPRNPWDRVLVFTSWLDLGSGDSKMNAKWQTRPEFITPEPPSGYRASYGSRVGDAYEAFEGAAEGVPYVPKLPRSVAKRLFPRDG